MPDAPTIKRLRADLLAWYDRHRRDLPWRARPGETVDPWAVMVSEVMLQQTTVATVAPRYETFMQRFASPQAMADAGLDAVLHAWQGLGYYRRARLLFACAEAIAREHDGVVPGEIERLRALPGLGSYTSAAVAAIGFGLPHVPVDGNVERVLSRLVALETPLPAAKKPLQALAGRFAAEDRASDFAQALMELGAVLCRPRKPDCLICPWRHACAARMREPERYPLKKPRDARPSRRGTAFLVQRADGSVFFRKRAEGGMLGGLADLPATPWEDSGAGDDESRFAPCNAEWQRLPGSIRHVFTHFSLEIEVLVAAVDQDHEPAAEGFWVMPHDFSSLALSTLTRKVLGHAGLRS